MLADSAVQVWRDGGAEEKNLHRAIVTPIRYTRPSGVYTHQVYMTTARWGSMVSRYKRVGHFRREVERERGCRAGRQRRNTPVITRASKYVHLWFHAGSIHCALENLLCSHVMQARGGGDDEQCR